MNDVAISDHVIEACARAAHEVNRAYCIAIGDTSQVSWDSAPEWQKSSARNGAPGAIAGNTPEQLHESWLAEKMAAGWKYGPVKDPEKKTHPCYVPYSELPLQQRAKDALYISTVRAVAKALGVYALSDLPLLTQEHIFQFFAFDHLPEALREVSRPFYDQARAIVLTLPRNPERTVALRKLLEAKDAAVRATLAKEVPR